MFAARAKRALVKREMQLLHALFARDADGAGEAAAADEAADEARLLDAALRCARRRVVVKRMRSAAALASAAGLRAPDYAVSGSTNRFDVYNVQPA